MGRKSAGPRSCADKRQAKSDVFRVYETQTNLASCKLIWRLEASLSWWRASVDNSRKQLHYSEQIPEKFPLQIVQLVYSTEEVPIGTTRQQTVYTLYNSKYRDKEYIFFEESWRLFIYLWFSGSKYVHVVLRDVCRNGSDMRPCLGDIVSPRWAAISSNSPAMFATESPTQNKDSCETGIVVRNDVL